MLMDSVVKRITGGRERAMPGPRSVYWLPFVLVAVLFTSCRGPDTAQLDTAIPAAAGSSSAGAGVSARTGDSGGTADSAETGAADDEGADVAPAAFLKAGDGEGEANPIDAARAYRYLEQICALGPRQTGSKAMASQQELLKKHFEELGAKVEFQRFQMRHPRTGQATPVANTIVRWHTDRKERILLCAHYDTRPQADNQRVPPRQRGTVFIGANDGGSGTALLMELGHHIPNIKNTAVGVDFVFFDAEEFVFNLGQTIDRYFVGSEYFARTYLTQPRDYRYRWGVLFDMVGDRDLQIYQEKNSMWWRDTRPLVKEIWATAKKLGVREFIPRRKHEIRDDHVPLRNIAKIPTCDLIDFDYPRYPKNEYWHTDKDTVDKCSGESLAKVGWVALTWLESVPAADSQAAKE